MFILLWRAETNPKKLNIIKIGTAALELYGVTNTILGLYFIYIDFWKIKLIKSMFESFNWLNTDWCLLQLSSNIYAEKISARRMALKNSVE